MDITLCAGYQKLLQAVERDEQKAPHFHDYRATLRWVVERAQHYAEKTGLGADEILNAWEQRRDYWYMNYYQDCNQPLLGDGAGRVFETQDALLQAIGKQGFRCPACGGVSRSPYKCDSGAEMAKGKVCNWNVGGLFKDLGKGVFVFAKDQMRGERIFMPLAWEG
jgi:hypothetical protein